MYESALTITRQEAIVTLTLNRPQQHNALNQALIKQLLTALEALNTDASVRVVMLAAVGTHSFCAGADLLEMQHMADNSYEENYQDALQLARLLHCLNTLNKPTIAVVQGAVFGGGVGLVACCDLVIASENACFSLSEVKLGLIPAVISPYVVAAIGQRQARRYFLTAEKFNASQAQQLNLVHQIVAQEQLTPIAKAFAKQLLKNSPAAIAQAKSLIAHVSNQSINETLIQETAAYLANIRSSLEGKEGLCAFLEKRKPAWVKN